jgi:hypothetical protein
MKKYLIVDEADPYHTYTYFCEGEGVMLSSVQDKDINDITVYEVSKIVKLEKRPSIVACD